MQYLLYLSVLFSMSFLFWKLAKTKIKAKKLYEKTNNFSFYLYLFLLCLITLLYFVFRYVGKIDGIIYGGYDAVVYKERFVGSSKNLIQSIRFQENEIGYSILVWFVRLFTDNFNVFLFVYYSILLFLAVKIVQNLDRNLITFCGIVTFVSMPFLLSMCLMRNILAYFILAYAFLNIVKKNNVKSILLILLASSIHISALIYLFVFFIYLIMQKAKMNFDMQIVFVAVLVVLSFFGGFVLKEILKSTKYSVYFNPTSFAFGQLIQKTVYLFLIFGLKKSVKVQDNLYKAASSTILIGFIVFPLQVFLGIVYRMYFYFDIALLFLQPSMYNLYAEKKGTYFNKSIVLFVIVIFTLYSLITHLTEGVPSYGLDNWMFLFGGV